jgi:outer membrane protein TolC
LRAALLAAAAIPCLPDTGLAASLRDALTNTYRTNPALEAGRAQLRAVDESVNQALAGYRPQVFIDGALEGARGETGRQPGASSSEGGLGGGGLGGAASTSRDGSTTTKRTTKQIGLSLRQNLYAGGSTGAEVRRAESQVSAQRANLLALEQDILLQAVDAYSAAWRDKAVLDLALNNEQRLRRQLDATRERFDVGEVARTDVAQAEARLSRRGRTWRAPRPRSPPRGPPTGAWSAPSRACWRTRGRPRTFPARSTTRCPRPRAARSSPPPTSTSPPRARRSRSPTPTCCRAWT